MGHRGWELCHQKVLDFINTEPYVCRWAAAEEPERLALTLYRLCTVEEEQVALMEISNHLGVFLDHARSALNYLAFRAWEANPDLPGHTQAENRVEFPISTSPENISKNGWWKALPEEAQQRILAVQPKQNRDGLAWLNNLARYYRHRLIHPTAIATAPAGMAQFYLDLEQFGDQIELHEYTPKADGEVLWSFRPQGSFDLRDLPRPPLHIGIDHPDCHRTGITTVLNHIRLAVYAVLNEWAGEDLWIGPGLSEDPPVR